MISFNSLSSLLLVKVSVETGRGSFTADNVSDGTNTISVACYMVICTIIYFKNRPVKVERIGPNRAGKKPLFEPKLVSFF